MANARRYAGLLATVSALALIIRLPMPGPWPRRHQAPAHRAQLPTGGQRLGPFRGLRRAVTAGAVAPVGARQARRAAGHDRVDLLGRGDVVVRAQLLAGLAGLHTELLEELDAPARRGIPATHTSPISVRDDKTSGELRIEAVITGKGGGQTLRTRQGVACRSSACCAAACGRLAALPSSPIAEPWAAPPPPCDASRRRPVATTKIGRPHPKPVRSLHDQGVPGGEDPP